MGKSPKLRSVEKHKPLYSLNKFPKKFAMSLGREIVYLLASRGTPRLEGSDWEEIFARIVGAQWKPSNVGLDDVVLHQIAWGAKTVKNRQPSTVSKIRLIAGRNSPIYSFGDREISKCEPNDLGRKVLAIWNERVVSVRKLYRDLRTVVLVKSDDLLELAAFEINTIPHLATNYWWQWNDQNNLEGFKKINDQHVFTWQPHGSQFTMIEEVPKDRLAIRIRKPPTLNREAILASIKFDESWIEILS